MLLSGIISSSNCLEQIQKQRVLSMLSVKLPVKKYAGVTLVELMITLAIIGVLSAVAIPMYTDFIATARQAVMSDNIGSIILFEES